jgi:hypothetical protein
VSRPEDGWKGGRIFRLNLSDSKAIQGYAAWHGVVRSPTFILFDKDGKEVRRWESAAPKIGELP